MFHEPNENLLDYGVAIEKTSK